MQFDSWTDLIDMGGHGLYVWLSYGFALLVLFFNVVKPWWQFNHTLRALAKKIQREGNSQ